MASLEGNPDCDPVDLVSSSEEESEAPPDDEEEPVPTAVPIPTSGMPVAGEKDDVESLSGSSPAGVPPSSVQPVALYSEYTIHADTQQ